MKKIVTTILGASLLASAVYAANDSDLIGEGMVMEIHKKAYSEYKNKDLKTYSLENDNIKRMNNMKKMNVQMSQEDCLTMHKKFHSQNNI